MSLADSIKADVDSTLNTKWNQRTGKKVPSTEDIALTGGAVELDATYLYSDLADSSKIAKHFDRRIAAKIMKSFLATTCRLIKHNSGSVISFDGDRVLGVFFGGRKNTDAAKCALQIKYVVSQIIKPKFEANYPSVKNAAFKINHGTGIDTGTVLMVRAGARGTNDLISIGRGPNLAAKLSDFRKGNYSTYITASVYNIMLNSSKFAETNKNMWEKRSWTFLGDNISLYRSSWYWKP